MRLFRQTNAIVAIYADAIGYSGQKIAAQQFSKAVQSICNCLEFKSPVYDRSSGTAKFAYLLSIFRHTLRFAHILWSAKPIATYINTGQTLLSLFRDGILPLVLCKICTDTRTVISIHGSWYLSWSKWSIKKLVFGLVLNLADIVVVLGPNQKATISRLIKESGKVVAIANTINISVDLINRKYFIANSINILYLGNLIDSKGYLEFLKAILLISEDLRGKVSVVLHGNVLDVDYSIKHKAKGEAEKEIAEYIKVYKKLGIKFQWITQCNEHRKKEDMEKCDVFVLPSRIEAQPISILEAMAHGSCIVATAVGEIPNMICDCGVLLTVPDALSIAKVLNGLLREPSDITKLGRQSRLKFETKYSNEIFEKRWQNVILGCMQPSSLI